jgi:hypothetical protein
LPGLREKRFFNRKKYQKASGLSEVLKKSQNSHGRNKKKATKKSEHFSKWMHKTKWGRGLCSGGSIAILVADLFF